MRIDAIYRPIDTWPGTLTANRARSPFDATWTATVELLEREVHQLQGRRVAKGIVIQLAVPEGAIRQDGQLMAGRRPPEHPGVIVSFDTPTGPLRFSCDRFERGWGRRAEDGWRQNVRAVALALEALRKVDRYGIGSGHEQYVGFQALPRGGGATPMGGPMTLDQAAAFLSDAANEGFGGDWCDPGGLLSEPDLLRGAYRDAIRPHHPDHGGDPAMFRRLTEARDLLAAHHGANQ